MGSKLNAVEVISLFVEDLSGARNFYIELLGCSVCFQDEVSSVLKLDNLMINLLRLDQAPELVDPLIPAAPRDGPCFMLTIATDDVNAKHAELSARGVKFLNGPLDRPWGRRTAAFQDPAGFIWEIAEDLPSAA